MILLNKKVIAFCLLLLVSFVYPLTITTENSYLTMPAKNITAGQAKLFLTLYEYYTEISPRSSRHYYILSANNPAATTYSVSISFKMITASISKGTVSNMQFYSFVSSELRSYLDEVNNITITTYTTVWDQTPLNTISAPAQGTGLYLVSFDTPNFAEGNYNLTFGTLALGNLKLDPAVTGCGVIGLPGTYTVTNNITANINNCISITSSNVIFDCANYPFFVNFTLTTALTVITVSNATANINNLTIQNCNKLYNWSQAISLNGVQNSTIKSVTITNATGQRGTAGSSGTTTCTNGLAASGVYGIVLTDVINLTIQDVTISQLIGNNGGGGGTKRLVDTGPCNGGAGGNVYGIFANSKAWNMILTRINITNLVGGLGGSGGGDIYNGGIGGIGGKAAGIYLTDAGSANNTISNIRTINILSGIGGLGGIPFLSLCIDDFGCFDDINCPTYGGTGNTGGAAYGFYLNSNNNTLTSITLDNITSGAGGKGIMGGMMDGNGGTGGLSRALYSAGTLSFFNTLAQNITSGAGGKDGQVCGGGSTGGDGGEATISYLLGTTRADNLTFLNVSAGIGGIGEANGSQGNSFGIFFNLALNSYLSNGSLTNTPQYSVYTGAGTYNNILLNITFNKSLVAVFSGGGNLTVKWYARVNVTNSSGSAVTSNINVTDNLSRNEYQGTGISLTPWFIVNDSTFYDGSITYYANHTIRVNSSCPFVQTLYSFDYADITVNITVCPAAPGNQTTAVSILIRDRFRRYINDILLAPATQEIEESKTNWFNHLVLICAIAGILYVSIYALMFDMARRKSKR